MWSQMNRIPSKFMHLISCVRLIISRDATHVLLAFRHRKLVSSHQRRSGCSYKSNSKLTTLKPQGWVTFYSELLHYHPLEITPFHPFSPSRIHIGLRGIRRRPCQLIPTSSSVGAATALYGSSVATGVGAGIICALIIHTW